MLIDQVFLERELAGAHRQLVAAEQQVNFCKGAVSMLEQLVAVAKKPDEVPTE